MLNVITASALLFGASAMASYEVVYTSGYATTTVYCSEGEKPTTPAGYYVHATHTKPVYYSSATPVYHTKPVYSAPVYNTKPVYSAPVYSAPAKPYSAPAKPVYSTSCTEEVYSAGYTAPAVYSSAPVYYSSPPVYSSAPVYGAPVYSAPSNGSYYNSPPPVYSAPVYVPTTLATSTYCPESTTAVYTAVYTAPAVVYTAPVYTAPAPVYTAPVYTAPAPVYTAPAYTPVSNTSSVPTPYAYTGSASGLQVSGAMVAIAAVAALMIGA